ncbi:class I adenylate-forming enzyme family protein [Fodinicurvata sp. EGI_FJ10296]|uniref:class I adenylate-forming enzyme family protein n=1 Tax=Fodinicurvata sp. EGI_FJ10296 TaxID=3231908 RepID=UPI0034548BC3
MRIWTNRDDKGALSMVSRINWKSEFLALSHRYADRVAVEDAEGPTTYAALFGKAAGVAAAIAEHAAAAGGLSGGAVASYLPNSRDAVAASYGTVLSGEPEAALNPNLAPDDMRHCLETANARLLITRSPQAAEVAASIPGLKVLDIDAIGSASLSDLPERSPPADGFGKILFTSGTTGKPKGIVHTQGGRWLANLALRSSLPFAPGADLNLLLLTPFSHGSSLLTYAYLDGGATITLLDRVDVPDIARRIESQGVNQIFAPPTVLRKLVDGLDGQRIETVKTIFSGTAPLSRDVYERARAIFGPVVRITYGKTEIFNPITILAPDETDQWFQNEDTAAGTCVGWPGPGVEVRIGTDTADDASDIRDSSGSASVAESADEARRGPVLIRARHGYGGMLREGVFHPNDEDAFHRSEDIGFVDAIGRLHLTGREASVIKSGGYRISPEEIEAYLQPAAPELDLAIVGLPSEYWGEVITCVAAGVESGWEHRIEDAMARLTKYKRPRLFVGLPSLPRNAIGKIMRNDIIAQILAGHTLIDGPYPALEPRSDAKE